jgi:hypothetical protein
MVTWMPKRLIVSGETIPEVKLFFSFLGRREKVTLGIYVAAIPALHVDDLGPRLFLTGVRLEQRLRVYIGPSLVLWCQTGEELSNLHCQMLEDGDLKTSRK